MHGAIVPRMSHASPSSFIKLQLTIIPIQWLSYAKELSSISTWWWPNFKEIFTHFSFDILLFYIHCWLLPRVSSNLGSISNIAKTNMYRRKAEGNLSSNRTEFSPLKSNKRSWSKTRVHFVLVKVHERHYEQKRDVFDARFEFVPPILIKHREESTDVYL